MFYSRTKVILLVLVVFQLSVQSRSATQCGIPHIHTTKLILHGNQTLPGEWPWHAAIFRQIHEDDAYACGGTLVSTQFVLTAAHCAFGADGRQLSNKNISVRLGVHNLYELDRTTVQHLSVQNVHLHPNYNNEDVQHDIAILELTTMAAFNKYVQPVCLGLAQDLTGLCGTAVGWGMTENAEMSPILRSSRMPVRDVYTCLKSDRAVFGETLSETIFCAGYTNGTTVCNGDSGGGLFFQQNNVWYLGGIVSFMGHRSLGDRRCSTKGYGAFTNVHMYLQWISEISNNHQVLSNPEIHSFDPKTGPWEGGTNITIRGINLGTKFEDVYGIKIGEIDCLPFRQLYVQTKQIVCKMDKPRFKTHRSGRVVVDISGFRGESTHEFVFVDPEIIDFTPKCGPIAGGTIIKIVGKDLNTGSRVKAYLDQHPCAILSTEENEATCRTTAAIKSMLFGKLHMEFDNAGREFNGDNFEYVANPSIDYVTSGDSGQTRTARGIPAGGIKIYVVGQNFFSIEKPKIYVYYRDQVFLNECKSTSNKEMQCLSPEIKLQETDTFQSDEPLQLEYGFIMDDVDSVKNLSSKLGSWFELYPNPVYYPFEETLKFSNGEHLIINGRNLDRASKESDVTVKIGDNAICNITSLTRNQLICQPPKDQEIVQANVTVIVGNGLTYDIGQISYSSASKSIGSNRVMIVSYIVVPIVFLIFILNKFISQKFKPANIYTIKYDGERPKLQTQSISQSVSQGIK